ncbi:tape measure protein [Cyanophage S-2L]|nr:tape measure protein [Cyanophage S-2L]
MSTAYQVDLVFGTRQADTQLARMEQRLRGLERAGGTAGGRDVFGPMGNSAQAATGKIDMLVGGLRAFAALGVVATAGAMANSILQMGMQAENTEVRVRGLTAGLDDYARFQEVAQEAAAKFGLSQQAAQAGLAQTYARLRPLGFTLSEVRDVYEGFNTAARNGGSTAQESEGAFRQLAQALGSGALRGDEFNSIMEQTPAIGIEVARVMGINAGQLREMAAEGKLTGDIVLKALQNIRTEGADKLDASLNTTSANVEKLKNRFIDMGTVVGSGVMPPILRTLQALNLLLDQATKNADGLGFALQQAMGIAGGLPVNLGIGIGNVAGRIPGGRQAIQGIGSMLGYQPEKQTFGPFMPEGLEQRSRAQEQARIRREKEAKDAATKSRSRGGGSSGPDFPAYITANQMRDWLRSQGYERTSGDFTNKGHRTPNHMLNAIDIGELDGSYAFAVQRAKALEARLRATGAFGNQLFGPTRDPRGHKDHVHIPTPGGRIRVTPGLAQLMGLNGKGSGGMAMQGAEWANEAAEKEAERQQKREDGLRTSGRALALAQAELKIAQASTDEQRIQATADKDRMDRMYEFADLYRDAVTEEERANIAKAQGVEIQRQQVELAKSLGDALVEVARKQEAAMRPRLDNIERLEATLRGPDAVRALERRNAVGEMSAAGVGPARAGELYDREQALDRQVERQRELNALWEEGGRTLGGLFSDLVKGTDDWQASLTRALESLASVLLQAGLRGIAENNQGGFLGGLLSQVMGSFDGGGYTGSGSRTGGLDGKGGFAAILHPNETVVDHTRGQAAGGGMVNVGGITVNVASDGTTEVDAAGGGELARGVQAAVTAEILRQMRPGGVLAAGQRG